MTLNPQAEKRQSPLKLDILQPWILVSNSLTLWNWISIYIIAISSTNSADTTHRAAASILLSLKSLNDARSLRVMVVFVSVLEHENITEMDQNLEIFSLLPFHKAPFQRIRIKSKTESFHIANIFLGKFLLCSSVWNLTQTI